jgi:hypothetical protein
MISLAAALAMITQPEPPAPAPKEPAPLVAFPHPLITEVLYAVPSGDSGDANKDGRRDVNGDEFIELVNPHDKPIQLGGYLLTDRDLKKGEKKFTSIRFKFPVMELKPGEVAVVFNGHKQAWKGPVGDTIRAPEKGNDLFAGAKVLTMGVTSDKQGLANKGDCVQLVAPDGKVVHCIYWGDAKPGDGVGLAEEAPLVSAQSVERKSKSGSLEANGSRVFSPGQWPPPVPGAQPGEAKPAETKPADSKPNAPAEKKPDK